MAISYIPAASAISGTLPAANLPTGSVLQVVNGTTLTPTSTSAGTYVQTNLTASITPKFATSKIVILCSWAIYYSNTGGYSFQTLYRNNTTNLGSGGITGLACMTNGFQANVDLQGNIMFTDSPATTSSTSYTVWVRSAGTGTTIINDSNSTNSIVLMEIAA